MDVHTFAIQQRAALVCCCVGIYRRAIYLLAIRIPLCEAHTPMLVSICSAKLGGHFAPHRSAFALDENYSRLYLYADLIKLEYSIKARFL